MNVAAKIAKIIQCCKFSMFFLWNHYDFPMRYFEGVIPKKLLNVLLK